MSVGPAVDGLLSLRGLTKDFDGATALHPVDLDVVQGEFLTLLGPSGCGKTTLLRLIAGLERPTAGDVVFRGRSVVALPAERRPFNMVFQSYALFPHLDVVGNVTYGLHASRTGAGERDRRVEEILELVGLGAERTRQVSRLSGGQQQRVALARALVNEPEVLLLDEPLAALDLALRKRLQEELRTIQQRLGSTFVYVTHDQEEALKLSDRIALFSQGRVVQLDTPHRLYAEPQSRFAASFIGEASLLAADVVAVADGTLTARLQADGTPVEAGWRGTPPRVGDTVALVVRPEDVRLSADVPNVVGVVERRTFLGFATRLRIRLTGSEELIDALVPNTELVDDDRVGLRVTRSVALTAEDPARP